MDIETLVKLASRAWSFKVLALLHEGVPARQAPLLAASGAGRTAFAHSLQHLVELGLLERNPGHGHPLRAEFRLTASGQALSPLAYRIEAAAKAPEATMLIRKSWTIPLLAVTGRPKYFSEIKRTLTPITDRALSISLQNLQQQQWIERSVDVAVRPPRPHYQAANEGAQISRMIDLFG